MKIPVWSETGRGRVVSASAKFVFNSQTNTYELQLRVRGRKRVIDARDLLPPFAAILEDQKKVEKAKKKAGEALFAEQVRQAFRQVMQEQGLS